MNVGIVEGLKRRGVDAFSARDAGKLGLTDELKAIVEVKILEEMHDQVIFL